MIKINTRQQMMDLRTELGVRMDWHEPDESDVVLSRLVNAKLDNAFGDETEAHVVLRKGRKHYMINLCDLLAWAAGHE